MSNEDNNLPVKAQDSFLSVIRAVVEKPDLNPEVIHRLLDAQERVMNKQAEIAFHESMARLQPIMPRIKKNGSVQFPVDKTKPDGPKRTAYTYAKYEDIDAEIRPLYTAEGFSVSYDTEALENGATLVRGTLSHVMGHSRTAQFRVALDTTGHKNNLTGTASSFSFGKRHILIMLFNIVTEGADDDGQAGGSEFISEEEAEQIKNGIREHGLETATFLSFLDVASVDEIQVKDLKRARNVFAAVLLQKRKAEAAKKTEDSK